MLDHREDNDKLLKAITGIVFLDVPSRGMDISSLKRIVEFEPNQALVMTLEHGNPWLDHLGNRFFGGINWNLDIITFYAMQKSPTVKRLQVRVSCWTYQVVN